MRVTNYSETELKKRVSVWEQRQFLAPWGGGLARRGRERQPSVAAHSIWMTLYVIHNTHFSSLNLWFQIILGEENNWPVSNVKVNRQNRRPKVRHRWQGGNPPSRDWQRELLSCREERSSKIKRENPDRVHQTLSCSRRKWSRGQKLQNQIVWSPGWCCG